MKISLCPYNYSFGTSSRSYISHNDRKVMTTTYIFREDFEWLEFSDYIVRHFKNKDKVNFIQFASSDGSEAYTQIISLLEKHQNTDKFFPIQAYDIDNASVKAARSGLINVHRSDKNAFKEHDIFFEKYFHSTDRMLIFPGDSFSPKFKSDDPFYVRTHQVADDLTNRVNFYQRDMFDVLRNLEDDSNTVLMCRNVLGHLSREKVNEFVDLASEKLKKGSLLVIGSYDGLNSHNDKYIQSKGFIPVMKDVYRRK